MSGRFSIKAMFEATDGVSAIMARIEKRANAFNGGLKNDFGGLGKRFSELTDGIGKIASVAATAGVALGGLAAVGMYDVVQASNSVGDGVAKLATVMTETAGFSEGAFERMKAASIDFSKHHKTTAEEFLKSAYVMVSAGLNEQQALAATRTSALMATATFGDAGEAGMALATIYNNLGNKTKPATEEIGRLGDVLTRVQQTFQLNDLAQLNEGLKYSVPTAKMYGMSLEEVSTAIGMLNNAGLQGSQAGTAFTASMQKMITASKDLGFKVAKTKDGMFDFGGTLQNIHGKFGNFATASDASKVALEQAFGRRGIAAIALLSDEAGKFAGNLGRVKDNANAAAQGAAIVESSGSGPLDILLNKFHDMKVAMGDAFSPVLGPYIDQVGKVVDRVGDWVTANKGLLTGGIDKAIATVTPIVNAFGDSFTTALPAIKEALGALFTGFGSGATWLETAKSAAGILGKIAAGALGVAAVFVGELAAGFQVAVDLSNDVIGAWNGMVAGLGATVFFFVDWAADIAAKWRWLVGEAGAVARNVIDGLVNGFKNGAQWVIDAAKNLGQQAIDGIKSALHINSPSRDFMEVGRFSALGVAQGIDAGAFAAVSASQSLADGVLAAMTIKAPAVDTSALGGMGAVTSAPTTRMFDTTSSWMPQINAPTLGTDMSYAASTPGPVSDDDRPQVVSSRGGSAAADDDRLEEMLQRLLARGGGADGGVITVRAERGSSAEVTEQPKGGGRLKLAPSGGI